MAFKACCNCNILIWNVINSVFIERILNINCIVYLFAKTKVLCDGDPPPLRWGAFSSLSGEGTGTVATARPGLGRWAEPFLCWEESSAKIRLPSFVPLRFLNRFDCKVIFTARTNPGLTGAAVLEPEQHLRGRIRPLGISREQISAR